MATKHASEKQVGHGPIVFIGPSLPIDVAKRTLPNADYRPPIKRGDLANLGPGNIVGIIDGVFGETLAISPGEIRDAIGRGVEIYGAASMGALRAVEIPKVKGVGRIYEMYSTGAIDRDDEVALLFAPETYQPLTVPLINFRYAVERLVRSASLGREDGNALIEACTKLHYKERTYQKIFDNSKLAHNKDVKDIIKLLRNFDLKRDDAQFLLETLADLKEYPDKISVSDTKIEETPIAHSRVNTIEDTDAPIMIWESGDVAKLTELISFLKVTGAYEDFALKAIGRFAMAGTPLRSGMTKSSYDSEDELNRTQGMLDATRLVWGWESPEEAHTTMRDLGLGLLDVASTLEAEVSAKRVLALFSKKQPNIFLKALRSELWLNNVSLKHEVMRLGALEYYAKKGRAEGPLTESELDDAKRTICRLRMAMQWSMVKKDLGNLGMTDSEQDKIIRKVALARRAVKPTLHVVHGPLQSMEPAASRVPDWSALGLNFKTSVKAEDSNRFSLSTAEAIRTGEKIAQQIGIVRIGMVGELDTLGIHVAQAFGERSGWSASFSSGKSESREGARVGSIMEEVEIYAQDASVIPIEVQASYGNSPKKSLMVDPVMLGLPYDSRYHENLQIEWSYCTDLLNCKKVLVPTASLISARIANDIFYSPRLGGKIFSSSGLGAGFSLAEATVHAASECIERHAVRLAEIELDNLNTSQRHFWFVDIESLPEIPLRIVNKYRKAGMCIRILDVTSEIAVPTFYVRVFEDPFTAVTSTASDGFACHPDPEVAITMALLEAAQTKAGVIAGGREDYSLQARSLGRHERPRTMVPSAQIFWFSNDRPVRLFQESKGLVSRDIMEELEWIVERVRAASYEQFLVTELTVENIRPACAVRVTIPEIETTNPLFTGSRARAKLIGDLLPR